MLTSLSIRDIVLIERLELGFQSGLTVLTGETGAGKSILLDALGLALGARADTALIRHGTETASVTAEFDLAASHPALAILREAELEAEGPLVIRRTLSADGRSRAFVNDQPVGVALLRQLGATLIEIHGQFDTHALFDERAHREILDQHGGLQAQQRALSTAWNDWQQALTACRDAEQNAARARAEESYLRDAVAHLDELAPKPGEETQLTAERQTLQHREKLVEALNLAGQELSGPRGAESAIERARRNLDRAAEKVGAVLDPARAALERVVAELAEAQSALQSVGQGLDSGSAGALEEVDDRLHALRAAGRRHSVDSDALPELRSELKARLDLLESGGDRLADLAGAAGRAKAVYVTTAEALSAKRAAAAKKLDKAVAAELPPLKLDKAKFATVLEPLPESGWGPAGSERIAFSVATNPGMPPGPLAKIASGGELARIMLALKVVLAGIGAVGTLVFDEVDSGVGGATADAVGERLARLADKLQVLVVTHSPQVAARGSVHWFVEKRAGKGLAKNAVVTGVAALDPDGRREEIARLLSGAQITEEARAQARRLMAGG